MRKNLKAWWNYHKDDVVVAGIATTVVALYVGLAVAAAKSTQKNELNRQRILTDAFNRGDRILPNPDGSFWIFETN
jgi:hypothetical protein